MALVEIDCFKQMGPESWAFNVFIEIAGNQFILNGFRVAKGAIYSPAIKGKKGYTNICFIPEGAANIIYAKVSEHLPAGTLKEESAATWALKVGDKELSFYTPNVNKKFNSEKGETINALG